MIVKFNSEKEKEEFDKKGTSSTEFIGECQEIYKRFGKPKGGNLCQRSMKYQKED